MQTKSYCQLILFLLLINIHYSAQANSEKCEYRWEAVKNGCTNIGSGNYDAGSIDYNPYGHQACKRTPGCYVSDGPVRGFWRCKGTPDCSQSEIQGDWNYCQYKQHCQCNAGYKYHQGQQEDKATCKKILCHYKRKPFVLHESKGEQIYYGRRVDRNVIGYRLVQCQKDGQMSYDVSCRGDRWISDGYACVDRREIPF